MTWTPGAPACEHEQDVLDLIAMDQWPTRASAALVAHASGCEVCRDLVIAASAIVELREAAPRPAALPDARVLWYRAQVQARADAARRATRPMVIAQAVAVTCALGLGLAWISAGATGLASWWQWLGGVAGSLGGVTDVAVVATTPSALSRYVGFGVLGLIVAAFVVYSIVELADDKPLNSGGRRD